MILNKDSVVIVLIVIVTQSKISVRLNLCSRNQQGCRWSSTPVLKRTPLDGNGWLEKYSIAISLLHWLFLARLSRMRLRSSCERSRSFKVVHIHNVKMWLKYEFLLVRSVGTLLFASQYEFICVIIWRQYFRMFDQ